MKSILIILCASISFVAASCSDSNTETQERYHDMYSIHTKYVHPVVSVKNERGEKTLKVIIYDDGGMHHMGLQAVNAKMENELLNISIPKGYLLSLAVAETESRTYDRFACDTIVDYKIIPTKI